jgi:hypothetical protein
MYKSPTIDILPCKQAVLGDPCTDNHDLVLLSTLLRTRQSKNFETLEHSESTVRAVRSVYGDKTIVDGAST